MLDYAPGLPSDAPPERSAVPRPFAIGLFAILALALSVVVLVHQEHHYELDPALRARSGQVNANSDISLMSAANFGAAMAKFGAAMAAGDKISTLSVSPVKLDATLVSSTGEERDAQLGPDLKLHVRSTGNRVSHPRGVALAAIAAGAPARILRVAERRFHLRPLDFEELQLDAPSGASPGGWAAKWSQPTDDDGLVAALNGTDVRRPFTPAKGSE